MKPLELPDSPDWMAEAVCASVDPAIFFPNKGQTSRAAIAICHTCPVRTECLNYAIDNQEQSGIWGGVMVEGRRALRGAAA